MTASPEIQNTSPAGSPAKAPEVKLLMDFKATLEDGWTKFDAEVPAIGKSGPLEDEDYVRVKGEYELTKKMLIDIKNDDELRANVPVRQKLDETIRILRLHNATSNKNKGYNKVLVDMETSLAELQKKVEKNNTTLPVAPVVVAGGAALATEAANGLSSAVRDGAQDLGKEVAAIKKNPMKKIAEFFGFTDSSIASDIKEALAEKKAGGFEGFFASIKLWFYGLMAKFTGADLTASLTPEEMKLAGIKGKVEKIKQEHPELADEAGKIKSNTLYAASYKGLILFNTIGLTVKNDQGKEEDINRANLGAIFQTENFYKLKYSECESLYKKYKDQNNKSELKKDLKIENTTHNPEYIMLALKLIIDPANGGKSIHRHIEKSGDVTVGKLLIDLHSEFSPMEKLDGINIDVSSIMGSTGSMFKSFADRFHFESKDGKIGFSDEAMKENAEKAGLNNPELLEYALSSKNLKILDLTDENIDAIRFENPKSKESLKKICEFWKKMESVIVDKFSLNQSADYKAYISKNPPSLAAVIKFYLVTGGNVNTEDMGGPKKMGIYALIWSDIFKSDSAERGTLVDQAWLKVFGTWLTTGPSVIDYIPEDVQKVASTTFTLAVDKIWDKTTGGLKEVFYTIPLEYRLGAGATIALAIYILWQSRLIRAAGGGLITGFTTAAILAAVLPIIMKGLESVKNGDGTYTLRNGEKTTENGVKEKIENMTK